MCGPPGSWVHGIGGGQGKAGYSKPEGNSRERRASRERVHRGCTASYPHRAMDSGSWYINAARRAPGAGLVESRPSGATGGERASGSRYHGMGAPPGDQTEKRLLIYLSRVRVPEGALKVLVLQKDAAGLVLFSCVYGLCGNTSRSG